jgi:hypothetical protein
VTYTRSDGKPDAQMRPILSERSRPILEWLRLRMKPELVPLLEARTALGIARYGVPLHSFDGRSAMQDALDEAVDCVQYLAQLAMEAAPMSMRYWRLDALLRAQMNIVERLLIIKDSDL